MGRTTADIIKEIKDKPGDFLKRLKKSKKYNDKKEESKNDPKIANKSRVSNLLDVARKQKKIKAEVQK